MAGPLADVAREIARTRRRRPPTTYVERRGDLYRWSPIVEAGTGQIGPAVARVWGVRPSRILVPEQRVGPAGIMEGAPALRLPCDAFVAGPFKGTPRDTVAAIADALGAGEVARRPPARTPDRTPAAAAKGSDRGDCDTCHRTDVALDHGRCEQCWKKKYADAAVTVMSLIDDELVRPRRVVPRDLRGRSVCRLPMRSHPSNGKGRPNMS